MDEKTEQMTKNDAKNLFFASYEFMANTQPHNLNEWLLYMKESAKLVGVTEEEYEKEWIRQADERYKANK